MGRFNMILSSNLIHLNQLMMTNNGDDARSRSSKRSFDELLYPVATPVITDYDESHTVMEQHPTSQCCTTNHHFSRVVSCEDDLELQYYKKKGEEEFYDHRQEKKLRGSHYSSTTSSKKNEQWDTTSNEGIFSGRIPVFPDTKYLYDENRIFSSVL